MKVTMSKERAISAIGRHNTDKPTVLAGCQVGGPSRIILARTRATSPGSGNSCVISMINVPIVASSMKVSAPFIDRLTINSTSSSLNRRVNTVNTER